MSIKVSDIFDYEFEITTVAIYKASGRTRDSAQALAVDDAANFRQPDEVRSQEVTDWIPRGKSA